MRNHLKHLFILLCFLTLASLLEVKPLSAQANEDPEGKNVKEVRFQGNRIISDLAIAAKIETKAGIQYSRNLQNRDLQRLYAWDQFDFIQVEVEIEKDGVIVKFIFVEREKVVSVVFRGRQKVKEDDLRQRLTTEEGMPFREFTAVDDVEALLGLYREKGFSLADVVWERQDLAGGGVQLIFNITEGPKTLIRDLEFEGNEIYKDRKLARKIQSKKRGFWGLFSSGKYIPEMAENDVEVLKSFYRMNGYLDVDVALMEENFNEDFSDVRLKYFVQEGRQFRVNAIRFEVDGDTEDAKSVSLDELGRGLKLQPGEPFSWQDMVADEKRVKQKYGALGRAFTKVNTKYLYLDNNMVDVIFQIEVGEQIRINQIHVRGNYQTKDKVIRREISVFPGDIYDELEMNRSIVRLRSLDYFESIDYDFWFVEPGKYDLVVEVVEKNTGRMTFGLGFNPSSGGFVARAVYLENNFDVFDWPKRLRDWWPGHSFKGAGQKFKVYVAPGTEFSEAEIAYYDPYIYDYPLGFGASIFANNGNFIDSEMLASGASVSLERRFNRVWSVRGKYSLIRRDIHHVSRFAPDDIYDIKGVSLSSNLEFQTGFSNINNPYVPSDGWNWNLKYILTGGPIGGEFDYHTFRAEFDRFHTLALNEEDLPYVFSYHTRFGYAKEFGDSDEVPIFGRFFMGGINDLRGFSKWEVGPRENGEPVGGNVAWGGTAEFSYPIPGTGEILRGVLFTDAGVLSRDWDDFELGDVRVSAGFGFRLIVPFLGPRPLQLDFGFPIVKEEFDEEQIINFSFSTTF